MELVEIPEDSNECLKNRCFECNNIGCKSHQIINNLSANIDLSDQIHHNVLYNIFLTIFTILQNFDNHEEDLIKIANVCHTVYKDMNPKEMGCTIN